MSIATRQRTSPFLASFVGAVVIAALAAYVLRDRLGVQWLIAVVGGINVATFALYAYDKAVSGRGAARVPESVLHLVALAGGTPAAFIAQRVLRHKTLKRPFRARFVWIMLVQVVALGAWVWYDWRRP